jgi:methylmalonyl-CoA/ethylmalonyl-CoA epimerase
LKDLGELIKRFDHVGIAVKNVDEALKTYRDILGSKLLVYKKIGTTQDYTFTQVSLGSQTIEMIEPIFGKESFLTKFLRERGEGLHHLTFQVYDIKETIKFLKSKAIRVVDEFIEIDPLWQTAFISPRSSNGVLIQLYETVKGSEYDHSR